MSRALFGTLGVSWCRTFRSLQAYLLTLDCSTLWAPCDAPQCRCVVDDFGDLVPVTGWF